MAYKKVSSYIEKVVENAFSTLQDLDQRRAFAKGLMMSVRLDRTESEPPAPFSPDEIQNACKFPLRVQNKYSIILGKDSAFEFLTEFGLTQLSKSSFKKRHTAITYKEFFQREAPVINKRSLVCTYAEWLYLESFPFEPKLPEIIFEYLPYSEWRPTRESIADDQETEDERYQRIISPPRVPAQIMLDDDVPDEISGRVRSAIQQFMDALGAELDSEGDAIQGSFFLELWFKFRKSLKPKDIDAILRRGKEALKANLEETSVKSTREMAEAASEMIRSLDGISEAVIRLGKLVIVKFPEGGQTKIVVETISLELHNQLEKEPRILRDPRVILNLLKPDGNTPQ